MKKISLTIGNFDGVHLGHQSLLQAAAQFGSPVEVLTFHPHPSFILAPEKAPVLVFDYAAQEHLLKTHGAEVVAPIVFNHGLSEISGREFFSREILTRKPQALVVGEDFRFGYGRSDGVTELSSYCEKNHILFKALPAVLLAGRRVSSSWLRELLRSNDFSKAYEVMGHPFLFSGQVVEGKKLGRTIGFPTANLSLPLERRGLLPIQNGVYVGDCSSLGGFVMNVGFAPTVHSDRILKVEVHFFDNPGDLYGKELAIRPLQFLRPELKFSGLSELKNQLQSDWTRALAFWTDWKRVNP